MTYLHYQYCLSNIVLPSHYGIEYFTKESDEDNFKNDYYQGKLKMIAHFRSSNINKLDGLIKRIYVPVEEIDKYINEEKTFFSYNPLSDTPEMYMEMNKIEIFDEMSIMKFVKNYGIPFHEQMINDEMFLYSTDLFPNKENEKFYYSMDVINFYEKLMHFRNVLKMWDSIIKDDSVELIKIKEEFKNAAQDTGWQQSPHLAFLGSGLQYGTELEELKNIYKINPEKIPKLTNKASELRTVWEEVKNKDLKRIATAYLNIQLKMIKSGETANRFNNGSIEPAIRFKNLLEVAGYQLKQAIFKNKKLEECMNCRSLFEPLHAHQKFCSPLPGRKRSTCENTYNQRQKRMRKKQEQERC